MRQINTSACPDAGRDGILYVIAAQPVKKGEVGRRVSYLALSQLTL